MEKAKAKEKSQDVETALSAISLAEHDAVCPHCGSRNVYGISRVVGYYGIIDNWNRGKRAEFKDRQKGKYKINESEL